MSQHPIPDAVLAQHIAILGKTGSGKTSTAKLAVEQVVEAGARVCVLDTIKSDWWGLTSSASGKRPGLPFKILGGPRGHVPLHSSAGKAIGQLVAEGKLPLSIVDMADFEAGGVQRFFVDFAQALFRHMRGVLYLVIEEAHEVAPKERAGFGAENLAIHWAKKLATAGRSKGIRLIVSSQSVQQLHNRVLGACETLIAHRLTTPADQKPILDWLKANAKPGIIEMVSAQLSSIKTGSGWICSGEAQIFERRDFPKFKTFDNSATPTGDEGDVDVTTAAVDHDELRTIIGDAVKEAEASDPATLKAKITKLEKELQAGSAKSAQNIQEIFRTDPAEINAAEQRGHQRGFDEALARGVASFAEMWSALLGPLSNIKEAFEQVEGWHDQTFNLIEGRAEGAPTLRGLSSNQWQRITGKWIDIQKRNQSSSPTPKPALEPRAHGVAPSRAVSKPLPAASGNGTSPPDRGEAVAVPLQKILDSISWWRALGITEPSYPQVAFRAGYAPSGGTFKRYLSELRGRGLIRTSDSRIEATAAGLAVAKSYENPSAESLRADVLNQIDRPLAKMLSPLINAYPHFITHEDLGARAEYAAGGGTFKRYLSSLRSLELVEDARGQARAAEWLFP
jgi:hypothetical protein